MWPSWESALLVYGHLGNWLVANRMTTASDAVDKLFLDIFGEDPGAVEALSGVTRADVQLIYGAMWSLMTPAQQVLVPVTVANSRNGLELVSFYGKKCHGDDSASAEIDLYDWENPDPCKTAEQVVEWLHGAVAEVICKGA